MATLKCGYPMQELAENCWFKKRTKNPGNLYSASTMKLSRVSASTRSRGRSKTG